MSLVEVWKCQCFSPAQYNVVKLRTVWDTAVSHIILIYSSDRDVTKPWNAILLCIIGPWVCVLALSLFPISLLENAGVNIKQTTVSFWLISFEINYLYLRLLVAGFTVWRSRLNRRAVHMGFLADEVAMEWIEVLTLHFYSATTISPMLNTFIHLLSTVLSEQLKTLLN